VARLAYSAPDGARNAQGGRCIRLPPGRPRFRPKPRAGVAVQDVQPRGTALGAHGSHGRCYCDPLPMKKPSRAGGKPVKTRRRKARSLVPSHGWRRGVIELMLPGAQRAAVLSGELLTGEPARSFVDIAGPLSLRHVWTAVGCVSAPLKRHRHRPPFGFGRDWRYANFDHKGSNDFV
jgi:hypothetical protein